MAGGQGTRFWPWSVKDKPKQFLSLMGEETMLQQTYNRFRKWIPAEKIFVVTSREYAPIVKEQIVGINDSEIIIEPTQRDTGPCIALTATHFLKQDDDEPFIAVPADHYIPVGESFPSIFKLAENLALKDRSIVTLGIKPTRPETGYGYMETEVNYKQNKEVLLVNSFIEKPSIEKATDLLKREGVYWNSGIFIWKPSTISYYMQRFNPEIWNNIQVDEKELQFKYAKLPKISVDYAILENANEVYSIPVNFDWDDIGSWSAWERLTDKENGNNTLLGNIELLSTKNCIIKSDSKKTIVIGVKDLIIASTEEGLLICHKSYETKIKEIINKEIKE